MASPGEGAAQGPGPDLEALKVLTLGPFALDCVEVEVLAGERTYPEEVTRLANENWESLLAEKPKLFDGPNWSMVRMQVQADQPDGRRRLRLTMQRSSYRFMQFTHMTEKGRSMVPLPERCNGAGLMALTETSDGWLVLGLRSRKAGALPLHWHCMPAGVVDVADPAAVLRKELLEEAAVEWSCVKGCEILAVTATGEEQGDKPEIVYRLQLSVPARELIKSCRAAEDRGEHEAFVFLRAPGCGPAPADGHVEEAEDVRVAELSAFLEGALGPLTAVSHRALQLLRDLPPAPILPLSA